MTLLSNHLSNFLARTFGDDVWDDSVHHTAERWMKAMEEFATKRELDFKLTTFEADHDQMIVVPNIEFESLCAHHLFPFYGVAHVGYIPNARMIGLSKIPRLVRFYAHRPNTQENMTKNIASHLKRELEAHGVAVVVEGHHTCMTTRGVRARNAVMRTSEMKGVFLTASAARSEFLQLIKNGGTIL